MKKRAAILSLVILIVFASLAVAAVPYYQRSKSDDDHKGKVAKYEYDRNDDRGDDHDGDDRDGDDDDRDDDDRDDRDDDDRDDRDDDDRDDRDDDDRDDDRSEGDRD